MRKLLLLFNLLLCTASNPAHPAAGNDPADGCDRALTPVQMAEKATNELLKREGAKLSAVENSTGSASLLRHVSIPLDSYIDDLGLEERLWDEIPLKTEQDLKNAIGGMIDPKKIVKRPAGFYPFTHFAIAPAGTLMAVTFHRNYFPDKDVNRNAHIFISSVAESKLKMEPLAEIVLPNQAYGSHMRFLENGQKIFIVGFWTENKKLRSDGFLYDLTDPNKPKLLMQLGDHFSGQALVRVTPLDSPDRDNLYYFLDHSSGQSDESRSLVWIDAKTGQWQGRVLTKMSSDVATSIECMMYDDDRRGYVAPVAGGFRFISDDIQVDLENNGSFRTMSIDRDRRASARSSGSAWLFPELSADGSSLKIRNELSGVGSVFKAPGLDYGQLRAMRNAFLYTERNHPNYREFLLWQSGTVELAVNQRLVHSEVHPLLFGGTTDSRSDQFSLELVFLSNNVPSKLKGLK